MRRTLDHRARRLSAEEIGWGPNDSGLRCQLRLRRGGGNGPFETITSPTGSGFRFAAEASAAVVAARDTAAIERAAQASLDIAAMLDAIVASARTGATVEPSRPAA